jgi:cardiolipin synthase
LRHLPNLITLIRLLAAPLAAWLLSEARYREGLVVVIVAGLTDWFDGFAARHLNAIGKTGVVFDPLADKVLLVVLFIQLAANHLIPLWMLLLALIRDLVIVIGALLLRVLRKARQFLPSLLGKISTFFQIMLVLLVLVEAAYAHPILRVLRIAALALSALFTGVSGLDYIRRGIGMAKQPAVPE